MDLAEAFRFAEERHRTQVKKGTPIPFIYHPLAVASTVIKYGGTEPETRAALIHDAVADDPGNEAELARRFGPEAARIALAFVEPVLSGNGSTSWADRKKAYLEKLKNQDDSALFVVACEELHDGTELLHDLRYQGAEVWKRYPVHSMELFWYYRELLQLFHSRLKAERFRALVGEFSAFVRALKGIAFDNAAY